MARLILDDVKPGMMLNEAVKNNNGQMLLDEGAVLTEKHIKAMKMWGIMDVSVKDSGEIEEGQSGENINPAQLEKAKKIIKDRFCLTDLDSELMSTIFNRAAIEYVRENKVDPDES